MLLLWYLERPPRPKMGFAWARIGDFGLAVLYPLVVVGAGALVSIAAGAAHLSETDWKRASFLFARVALGTFLAVTLTEEGFFRGRARNQRRVCGGALEMVVCAGRTGWLRRRGARRLRVHPGIARRPGGQIV